MKLYARTRTVLAWSSWLATFGCCAAGLVEQTVQPTRASLWLRPPR